MLLLFLEEYLNGIIVVAIINIYFSRKQIRCVYNLVQCGIPQLLSFFRHRALFLSHYYLTIMVKKRAVIRSKSCENVYNSFKLLLSKRKDKTHRHLLYVNGKNNDSLQNYIFQLPHDARPQQEHSMRTKIKKKCLNKTLYLCGISLTLRKWLAFWFI